ncbi:glycerophosphodiester phosphodiesterase domain-containing protein 4 isoform X8 [Heterocephalus glaber]|uniref:Glycerophosphodiester phosphodiesterase domain-containing protein 4 isoform X8 n=1 Tax=Heterocephalus glaber TaxID=10181 RepID=A0AAX6S363_HETGA|nr:glycerophosphodiester phosphodiesterase domain-containing protein 4 isoform X8 [Heterocephalus glaber]
MPRKVNRIESRRKEEENRNPQIAHIFNYKRYITFLTGCYSCHWKFRRWEKTKLGSCCCTRREQCFCVFLAVAFVFSVIMLFTWIETSNEYFGFDCVLLPCHPALQIMDRNLYKLVVFLVTGAWFFWSILMLSLFGILTVYTSLLLILGVLLLWERIELYLHTCHKAGPENTMMAFEKAVEEGASGLETDVHISFDNVPYLMHDYDLRRTTNIREVMPEAAYSHPSSFNWTTLSTLNAGEWFVRPETRPFFNMKRLSQADKKRARNQSIPRLADLLKIAKKEKKIVIFDLFGPPQKHPLRHTFVHQVVSVILASKIEQNLIFWLPGHDRQYVRFMAPGFQHVGRLVSVEHLTKENISIINVDYKRLFYKGLRDYQAANIYINLYIVNEPWIFSLAWCSRINSVTTDNIPVLSQLTHPHFFMTPRYYLSIWLLLDIVSAIFIAAIFCFHWWREVKEEKLLEASRIFRDSQSLSLSVEQSESQEASHLPKKSPPRVGESPWTPALPGSRRKLSHTSHFEEHLKKKPGSIKITQNTVGPLMPTTDFEDSQVPTNWGPAGEAAPQSTLLTTKADELTVPFTEAPYPEIHPKTPVLEPAKESNPSDIPL